MKHMLSDDGPISVRVGGWWCFLQADCSSIERSRQLFERRRLAETGAGAGEEGVGSRRVHCIGRQHDDWRRAVSLWLTAYVTGAFDSR